MKKEKEYIKNTIILLIGKFSTQIISFLLLPIYTYKLATSNYGYIDLVQTYISLLVPIVLLQLDSAVFRYLIDIRKKEEEKNKIISTSFIGVLVILFFSIIIAVILKLFIKIEYFYIILINIIVQVFNTYVMAIARGNGHNTTYSISSIIMSIVNLLVNLVLILLLGFDARSILFASILGNILSFIYVFFKEHVYKYIRFKYYDSNILKKLLKYSIPMIPNVLSWWVVGVSDRTIIVYFLSTAANGIYSVSCKFSNLLNSIFSIFSMSWQEMVSMHINDSDSSEFISKMIIKIFNFFILLSCGIVGLLPILYLVIIGKEYINSYNYIPILLTANLFSVLVGLFGGIYIAKKMTKKVATTTIYSAIINIVINIIFIKKFGLYAASGSTLLAYFIMTIYRFYDVKKIVNIKLNLNESIIYIIAYIILIILYYFKFNLLSIIMTFIISILYIYNNKNFIYEIIIKKFKKSN